MSREIIVDNEFGQIEDGVCTGSKLLSDIIIHYTPNAYLLDFDFDVVIKVHIESTEGKGITHLLGQYNNNDIRGFAYQILFRYMDLCTMEHIRDKVFNDGHMAGQLSFQQKLSALVHGS